MSEEIVGVHTSGVELHEGMNVSISRFYCANCTRKIHCSVKVDKKTKEAVITNNCKSPDCECKCKTHYACKLCGYLHPYSQNCNNPKDNNTTDSGDEFVEEINKQYRELQKEKNVEYKP